jgi:hypothetical protein
MKRFTYRRATAGIAAAIACLGSATGAGAGVPRHDEWARDARERATPTAPVVHPDDRARHGREPVSEPATIVSSTEGGGFDWADAGIGAAGAIGFCLAGAGSYVLVVRRRRTAFS